MRIHDQNPLGGLPGAATAGTQGSRGSEASPGIGGKGAQIGRPEQGGSGPDRVSLSNLAASLGPEATDREADLERLSELFHRGVYEEDPGAIAENLIDEGLMSPPEETGGATGETA